MKCKMYKLLYVVYILHKPDILLKWKWEKSLTFDEITCTEGRCPKFRATKL